MECRTCHVQIDPEELGDFDNFVLDRCLNCRMIDCTTSKAKSRQRKRRNERGLAAAFQASLDLMWLERCSMCWELNLSKVARVGNKAVCERCAAEHRRRGRNQFSKHWNNDINPGVPGELPEIYRHQIQLLRGYFLKMKSFRNLGNQRFLDACFVTPFENGSFNSWRDIHNVRVERYRLMTHEGNQMVNVGDLKRWQAHLRLLPNYAATPLAQVYEDGAQPLVIAQTQQGQMIRLKPFETTGYLSLLFPELFTDGLGDFANQANRPARINISEYLQHLCKFHDGRFNLSFEFGFWAWQTRAKERLIEMVGGFLMRRQQLALRLADIPDRFENREEREKLAAEIISIGGRIPGLIPFWKRRRHDLMSIIRIRGGPHLFLTLSAADMHLVELHRVCREARRYAGDMEDHRNSENLYSYPNIVTQVLQKRFELFMTSYFTKNTSRYEVEDYWGRVEWQERGSAHWHVLIWIKDGPDISQIDLNNPEQVEELSAFYRGIIDPVTPPLEPAIGVHPCARRSGEVPFDQDVGELVSACQIHACSDYCRVRYRGDVVCSQGYPFHANAIGRVGRDHRGRHRWLFERPENAEFVAAAPRTMLSTWRGNLDLQPVVDMGMILEYITKYVSKSGQNGPSEADIVRLHDEMGEEETVNRFYCRFIILLTKYAKMGAQQTFYSLLQFRLVKSTFTIIRIEMLGVDEQPDAIDEEEDANQEDQRNLGRITLDRYSRRAEDLGERSLQWMLCSGYRWQRDTWIAPRNPPKRTLIVKPVPMPRPNAEDSLFCQIQCLLQVPWRDIEVDFGNDWVEAFQRYELQVPFHFRFDRPIADEIVADRHIDVIEPFENDWDDVLDGDDPNPVNLADLIVAEEEEFGAEAQDYAGALAAPLVPVVIVFNI